MKKNELAGRLARRTGLSRAAAADRLDGVVHDILTSLRQGHAAQLPGLGTFLPGHTPGFRFETPKSAGRRRGGKRWPETK